MTAVVISQPMLFPWVGLFEQIQLSDVFIFYDDVQFSKGSLTNRVQLKTQDSKTWMTIPLSNLRLGQKINEVTTSKADWRRSHCELFHKHYSAALYFEDAANILSTVYSLETNKLSEIVSYSIIKILDYYELRSSKKIYNSSDLDIEGSSSERVLQLVKKFQGTEYVTGHGAKNYLDHYLFELNDIRVEYMDYEMKEYSQLHGEFNPYVSILDLIANCGKEGRKYLVSKTKYWKEFLNE